MLGGAREAAGSRRIRWSIPAAIPAPFVPVAAGALEPGAALERALAADFRVLAWRHTFALHTLRNGSGLVELPELFGHAQVATTQAYLDHLAMEDLQKKGHERGLSPVSWPTACVRYGTYPSKVPVNQSKEHSNRIAPSRRGLVPGQRGSHPGLG